MVSSAQISSFPASLSTPATAHLPSSIFHHPASLPWVFAAIPIMLLWSAAARRAPPYLGAFLGTCLVPWLVVRVRLRRIDFLSLTTGSHRGCPNLLVLDLGPSGYSGSDRFPAWWPRWIAGEMDPVEMSPVSSMDSGEFVLVLHPCKTEPMGFSQTQKPSRISVQAAFQSQACRLSQAVHLSRAKDLSQAVQPTKDPTSSVCSPQFLCGEPGALIFHNCYGKDPDEVAHFFEPLRLV